MTRQKTSIPMCSQRSCGINKTGFSRAIIINPILEKNMTSGKSQGSVSGARCSKNSCTPKDRTITANNQGRNSQCSTGYVFSSRTPVPSTNIPAGANSSCQAFLRIVYHNDRRNIIVAFSCQGLLYQPVSLISRCIIQQELLNLFIWQYCSKSITAKQYDIALLQWKAARINEEISIHANRSCEYVPPGMDTCFCRGNRTIID